MSLDFRRGIQEQVLLADGAMGTMLIEAGVPVGSCLEELVLSKPLLVQDIHNQYIEQGAQVIQAHTFGANEIKLARFGLADRVHEINHKAVEIARKAACNRVYVAGSLGPTGKLLSPLGPLSLEEAYQVYANQIQALIEAGIDLLIIETMSQPKEAVQAVRAARDLDPELPIICQMSFLEDGKTVMGTTPQGMVDKLANTGVDVLGVNCGAGVQALINVLHMLQSLTDLPLSIQPNAGLPQLVDGRTYYYSSPAYFASKVPEFVACGARLIGGCCGTTPEHIHAMEQALHIKPHISVSTGIVQVTETTPESVPTHEDESAFARKLGREFVTTVEIDPPKGTNLSKVYEGVKLLLDCGVDAINISDSPMARVRLSPIAIGHHLLEELDTESILHFTCRDRNLLGIQSELLGAHALGLRNILALTGDPPSIGDHPDASGVFDVDSLGLVRIISALNQGTDLAGNPLDRKTNFCIGVAANPAAVNLDREIERLEGKIQAGAHFVQTQPIYDLKLLQRFLKSIQHLQIPVLVGVLPLFSVRNMEFLHNEVPGIVIPEGIQERMYRAKQGDQAQVGISISREFTAEAKGLVQGVYFMPPLGRYSMVVEILKP